ncbi:hypothetical protein [Xanthomonas campestris]|uniref:hypothetical protein n=1 Tax=Xanthomonas campestris TaxID=339 RepID=UPI002B23D520|nr:hypothetical protein [Xanthomonas campestris]MEA9706783.1 hypothetical protein [Xanthomonas campestris pv. raphani]MEA9729269.1 hypothetical protein [Xanthomonas campestris pv. raphani]MEA9900742.1 hypothetical protein [Xanthomonas campestris pv. raphani]
MSTEPWAYQKSLNSRLASANTMAVNFGVIDDSYLSNFINAQDAQRSAERDILEKRVASRIEEASRLLDSDGKK